MLKLKLQYSGLIGRANSLEETLMLGKTKAKALGATKDKMGG